MRGRVARVARGEPRRLDDDDAQAGELRQPGGRQPGDAAADHADVGVEVAVEARAAGALGGRDPDGACSGLMSES